MKILKILASIGTALAVSGAGATAITSYDVVNANASGTGGWSHFYSGTISHAGGGLYDYTGGSGTLNDGVTTGSEGNSQLFLLSSNTSIALHLAENTLVNSIEVFGGNFGNAIPGTLTGWSVTINGMKVAISSTNVGSTNDLTSLIGTGLEFSSTNTVVLSDFRGGWNGYFNATEIAVDGNSNVPEPESLALVGLGLFAMAAVRRKNLQK